MESPYNPQLDRRHNTVSELLVPCNNGESLDWSHDSTQFREHSCRQEGTPDSEKSYREYYKLSNVLCGGHDCVSADQPPTTVFAFSLNCCLLSGLYRSIKLHAPVFVPNAVCTLNKEVPSKCQHFGFCTLSLIYPSIHPQNITQLHSISLKKYLHHRK